MILIRDNSYTVKLWKKRKRRISLVTSEEPMDKWIIKDTESVAKTQVIELIKKQCRHPRTEKEFDFYTIEAKNWINVVARTHDDRYIMVRQHRLGIDAVTLETPGGLIDEGESPEECARRELMEETGHQCATMRCVKKLAVNPAIMSNYIYIFFADGCRKVGDQRLDEAEDIEIVTLERDELVKILGEGGIENSLVVLALLLCSSLE